MKRRPFIVLSLVLIAVVVALLLWQTQSRSRVSFQGKSARKWAHELYSSFEPRGTNAAAAAFQTMGSNAVPDLQALLYSQDPFYEKALLKFARYLPTRIRVYLFQKIRPGNAIEYRLGAIRALGVIGPDAVAALPDLLATLADSDSRVRWMTAQTIALLGPEAVAALVPLTTNTDANLRHATVYALGEARTNALPAVPALILCSTDTNQSVRASALYSLGRIGLAAVPQAIDMAVTNSDPQLRNAAFRSLVAMRPPLGRVLNSQLVITNNTPDIRRMAYLSMWSSRQTNAQALRLYQTGLADEDPTVRELAQKIMDRLSSTNRNQLFPL